MQNKSKAVNVPTARRLEKFRNSKTEFPRKSAVETESVPQAHDPESRRRKTSLPLDSITYTLRSLRKRGFREEMEMTRQMVTTPVALSEEQVVEAAAIRSLQQQKPSRGKLRLQTFKRRDRITKVLQYLAHDDEIVRPALQHVQIEFNVALDQSYALCPRPLHHRRRKAQIQRDALHFVRHNSPEFKKTRRISGTDINDRAEQTNIHIRPDSLHITSNLVFIDEALEIERRGWAYRVVGRRIESGNFLGGRDWIE